MHCKHIGPRAGFVLDLFGDGKTVIKASYGRFEWNPSYDISWYANPAKLKRVLHYGSGVNGNLRFGDASDGDCISEAGGRRADVDPDLKQPHTHELAVQFERDLHADYSMRVSYVYRTQEVCGLA